MRGSTSEARRHALEDPPENRSSRVAQAIAPGEPTEVRPHHPRGEEGLARVVDRAVDRHRPAFARDLECPREHGLDLGGVAKLQAVHAYTAADRLDVVVAHDARRLPIHRRVLELRDLRQLAIAQYDDD